MIILVIGVITLLGVLIYCCICAIQGEVFQRLGFVDEEIPIWKVELNKHFSK